jgi:hypothetical protein
MAGGFAAQFKKAMEQKFPPVNLGFSFSLAENATNQAKAIVEEVFSDRNMKRVVEEFLMEELVPEIGKAWHGGEATYKQHLPMYWSRSKNQLMPIIGRSTRERGQGLLSKEGKEYLSEESATEGTVRVTDRTGNYLRGLRDLYRAVTTIDRSGTTSVGLGPMDKILAMDIADYSLLEPKKSKYTSWFYTVEFGTGVAENVGANWVNTENKDLGTNPPGGQVDGSWLTGYAPFPLHIFGQKPFHFLHDENHAPQQYYVKFVDEKLPARFERYFATYGINMRGRR